MEDNQDFLEMRRVVTGFAPAMAVSVIARLGIPDLLADGPRSATSLAVESGAEEVFLRRVLRYLASEGILSEEGGEFGLNGASKWLRTGIPGSLSPRAAFAGGPTNWAVWGKMLEAVKAGRSAMEIAFGQGLFEYLGQNPAAAAEFNNFMVDQTRASVGAILKAYPFDSTRVLADIGGGQGALVAGVLKNYPDITGILFDLPQVIAAGAAAVHAAGMQDRCKTVAGNFFEEVPQGADTYALKFILHDWPDERCVSILKNCRRAMPEEGRVLIIEHVRPDKASPHIANFMDMQMLVITSGGRERTVAEFQSLLAAAGLVARRTVATDIGLSVLECAALH
jgi:hypothetical protein